MKKSKDYPNPASHADGVVVIYDSAFERARSLERIISHELSHQSFKDLSDTEQQDYRRAAGWHLEVDKDLKFYWIERDAGYVAEDGKTSYEEDYANNLEYFLYEPAKLKEISPKIYTWIEKKFGKDFKLEKDEK